MARISVDIDEAACTEIMRRYKLATKEEAINFALRRMAGEPMTADEARAMRSTGWGGDLNEMLTSRASCL